MEQRATKQKCRRDARSSPGRDARSCKGSERKRRKKRKDKAVGVTGEDSGATAQAEQPSESPYQVRRML